jgi:hypothetical protein
MLRPITSILGVLVLICTAIVSATAQEATPIAAPFSDLGLPELEITVTADAYEGIPATIDAGRYLVTITVADDTADMGGGGVNLFQPPDGMSADTYIGTQLLPPADGSDSSAVATSDDADAASSPDANAPAPMFQVMYAGGTYAGPGQTAQVVLDLGPGEWIAWANDPAATQPPVVFEAVGQMPADLPDPETGATILMGEYLIEVSDGALRTGPQVVRIDNIGAQPHFVAGFLGPDGMTADQVQVVLDEQAGAEMTGTPATYSGLNPDEDLMPGFFTATQSGGTSQWIVVDLQPGSYLLICFFPDMGDLRPHAMHGMYTVIEVDG